MPNAALGLFFLMALLFNKRGKRDGERAMSQERS